MSFLLMVITVIYVIVIFLSTPLPSGSFEQGAIRLLAFLTYLVSMGIWLICQELKKLSGKK